MNKIRIRINSLKLILDRQRDIVRSDKSATPSTYFFILIRYASEFLSVGHIECGTRGFLKWQEEGKALAWCLHLDPFRVIYHYLRKRVFI